MPLAIAETRPLVTVSTVDILHGYGACMAASAAGAPGSAAAWPSANRAIYCPIYLAEAGTIVKLWIANGATNGDVDIGLYSEGYARLVSAGTTAMAGTSVIQTFDVADTPVAPGRYYLGIVCSTVTTATFMRGTAAVSICRAFGLLHQAAALPLPDPMVPVAASLAYTPLAGLSYRVTL